MRECDTEVVDEAYDDNELWLSDHLCLGDRGLSASGGSIGDSLKYKEGFVLAWKLLVSRLSGSE